MRLPALRSAASVLIAALIAAVLPTVAWSAVACSTEETVLARSGDQLVIDVAVSADLDGDGVGEEVVVEGTSGRVVISDGETVYRSREKWRVAEAHLGDTDHNGLLEVVTLLDANDGRHLGLFAYMEGEYRERLVTSDLTPRPLSLQVVAVQDPSAADAAATLDTSPAAGGGDVIMVTEESASPNQGARVTVYRWNGFGFTALQPSTPR